jgi:erythromycin esterase
VEITSERSGSAQPVAAAHARFVRWAERAAVPLAAAVPRGLRAGLEALGEMVGDAPIVALGEATHGAAEPLELRNRLLKFLMESKGFTAIAIESGIVEGRRVNAYIRGTPGDPRRVLAEGISWTFDQLPQNRVLIRWLRQYNERAAHARKINFYGLDVPGSPGEPAARCGINTALVEALSYLRLVDATACGMLTQRIQHLWGYLHFDFHRPADTLGYDCLTQSGRDELTAAISDLITLMECCEAQYIAASSSIDYEWAYRAAVGARQVDAWLRQIPMDWRPQAQPLEFPSEQTGFLAAAMDIRDRAQADNLDWIIKREGPSGKVFIYTHRYHSSTAPVEVCWGGPHAHEVMGTYLRRRLGQRLVSIGNMIGKGDIRCPGVRESLPPPAEASIDGLAAELGLPVFLLDLRRAPNPVKDYLRQFHVTGYGVQSLRLAIADAFDILLYVGEATAALPARGVAKSPSGHSPR